MVGTAVALTSVTVAQEFRIGQNFLGATYFDSFFSPPDTMAAVGPDHIAELINGSYTVYSKANGQRLLAWTLDQFWAAAGATPLWFAFDPRIVYDKSSDRWFAVAADDAGSPQSRFLVGVSRSSDPLQGWTAFAVDADPTNQRWIDFPTLGLNGDRVVVVANAFPVSFGTTEVAVLVIPKADLLAPSPTVVNATLFNPVPATTTGYTVQPVLDESGAPGVLRLLSAYNIPFGTMRISFVAGTPTSPLVSAGGFISVPVAADPPNAAQPPMPFQKPPLHTGTAALQCQVVQRNSSLWAVYPFNLGGRSAARWYEFSLRGAIRQTGVLSDPTLAYYYPSIAVNDFGDVVIAFSGSSAGQPVSAYAAVGQTKASVTTFAPPVLLRAGTDDFVRLDTLGRNRWGDYSATVVDPVDERRFWTVQEFVLGDDIWGTQITEIIIESCYPDCDQSGALDIFDFLCFQNSFVLGESYACDCDPDPACDIFDFLCFQNAFVAGCP